MHIPNIYVCCSSGYSLPWESEGEGWEYPLSFAPPLQVAIEASNGASDYGNKFGEPVLSGESSSPGSHPYRWYFKMDASNTMIVALHVTAV